MTADDSSVWFGPDGALYGFGGTTFGGTPEIRVRAAASGNLLYSVAAPAGFASDFGAAGSHVVAAFTVSNGVLGVFDFPLATTDLVAAACREAGRNLTLAEWRQYVGNFDVYEKTCTGLP